MLVVWVVACLAAAAWIGVRMIRAWRDRRVEVTLFGDADETPWPADAQLAVDPVVGWRPRRNADFRMRIAPLGGERVRVLRHHDNLGLIRTDDVRELPGPPRVLLVGDSHLMGVVSNADNAADVLERSLRASPGLGRAAVLNGSSGLYSLYQDVLRARSLVDALRPGLLVIAVFLGNDFVELEDLGRPHLDDAGAEQPKDEKPPPETTSSRRSWLGLPEDDRLFWQGLNQACCFHQQPDRIEPALAKARRCVELADKLAQARRMSLVFALVPSYDLVFPERAAARGERVAEVVSAGINARLRDGLRALLAERGLDCVDLLETFRQDGRDALYAADYHIFIEGHRLLAEALLEPVAAALEKTAGR